MEAKEIKFIGANGVMLPGTIWYPTCTPSAVVQITHGMTEHIGRYTQLAEYLTAYGVVVAGFDLRGHGRNPSEKGCASLGEAGWKNSLHDMHLFHLELSSRVPHVPHIMLGFSLGSFLVRDYLSVYADRVDGAILMGTGQQMAAVLDMLKAAVKQEIRKCGFNAPTPRVTRLSFDAYNRMFSPCKTPMDWFCSDEDQLTEYRNDPLCRKTISSGLFWQLLDAMKRTGTTVSHRRWEKEMPVLLLSGQDDPVGDFGRGVQKVRQTMMNAGMQDVQLYLLPGRHDLLHEYENGSSEEALDLLTNWLFEHI